MNPFKYLVTLKNTLFSMHRGESGTELFFFFFLEWTISLHVIYCTCAYVIKV